MEQKEYDEVVALFSDKTGKFSYRLVNHSLMTFANRSSVVKRMIKDGAAISEMIEYITSKKASNWLGRTVSSDEVTAIIAYLDALSKRSALKELTKHLRLKASNTKVAGRKEGRK